MHPLWKEKEEEEVTGRNRRVQPSDAQAQRGRSASWGCMQKQQMLQHTGLQPSETSLPVNRSEDETLFMFMEVELLSCTSELYLSPSGTKDVGTVRTDVWLSLFSIFSSLFLHCSLILIEDGRCALQLSVLVQSILKHRVVWACVSAQSALGQRPVPALLSPHPPSK